MLIDVLHGLLDEGKVIAVNGMLQIKIIHYFAVGKECPAAERNISYQPCPSFPFNFNSLI